jgi:hypothetical protein
VYWNLRLQRSIPRRKLFVLRVRRRDGSTRTAAHQQRKGEWGDYLTVGRDPHEKLFAATGFTMPGKGNGLNRDKTPRFVIFGRASRLTLATTAKSATSVGQHPPPAVAELNTA